MKTAALLLYALAYLGALAFAVRFLMAKEYMNYHAQVVGKSWDQLDHGAKVVFTALMRVIGGALLGAAIAGLWMTWLLSSGVALPFILTPTPGLIAGVAALWAALHLKKNGGVDAPVAPVAGLVVIAGLGLILMAASG